MERRPGEQMFHLLVLAPRRSGSDGGGGRCFRRRDWRPVRSESVSSHVCVCVCVCVCLAGVSGLTWRDVASRRHSPTSIIDRRRRCSSSSSRRCPPVIDLTSAPDSNPDCNPYRQNPRHNPNSGPLTLVNSAVAAVGQSVGLDAL